jgi:glycosyltransferase involved in cell wall biosynthesis
MATPPNILSRYFTTQRLNHSCQSRDIINMKSVCLIVQNYYDIDPRVRRKAEALVKAGYDVDVIALRSSSSPAPIYFLNNVQIHTLPLKKKRGPFFRYLYEYIVFFLMVFFKVVIMTKKKKYIVLDVNTLPDFLVFAASLPKCLGAKVVLDMHEIMPEFYISKYKVANRHWLIRLIGIQEKLSFSFADHVITINDPIQKLLVSRGLDSKKATIIMNSADESIFSRNKHPNEVSENKNFVMMYHGSLTPIYGLDIALNAFGMVHNEMLNAEFWIIGDGSERISLENLVRNLGLAQKVKFIGMVPQQNIPEWLSHCDVGVLPTRRDVFLDFSFSNKLPEYIVMGKPVIVSRLKAIQHYFSEQALIYFEPQNSSELSQRMVELYKNPTMRTQLVKQAKKEYAKITWEVMRKRYLDLITSMSISLLISINMMHCYDIFTSVGCHF